MKKPYLIYFLASCFLIGCLASSTPPEGIEATPSAPFPTSITTPTEMALLTAISTPSSAPAESIQYECLEISDNLPMEKAPDGVLVFKNEDNTDALLWNMQMGTQVRFPRKEGERILSFSVSPDAQYVVYHQASLDLISGQYSSSNDRTVMAKADGIPIWSQLDSWYSWFDNERLIRLIHPASGYPYMELLNPLSGERQELHPDYPNIERMFSNNPIDKWRGIKGLPIYDPTLTKVVYAECDSVCDENIAKGVPDFPVVLLDVQTGTVLARLKTTNYYGGTPLWLPDGSQFVMSADILSMETVFSRDPYFHADEFYVISRNGQVRQLTNFMNDYMDIEIYDSYMLSPDGQQVAFWIVAKPSNYSDARLAVMNMMTGVVINYCLKGAPFMDASSESLLEPIWSPDSTQLLIMDRDPQNEDRRRVILVNTVENFAGEIAENIEPVGWMIAP
jgi:hypothetical protein